MGVLNLTMGRSDQPRNHGLTFISQALASLGSSTVGQNCGTHNGVTKEFTLIFGLWSGRQQLIEKFMWSSIERGLEKSHTLQLLRHRCLVSWPYAVTPLALDLDFRAGYSV